MKTKEELIKLFEDETDKIAIYKDKVPPILVGLYHEAFTDWLIERLTKKDEVINRQSVKISELVKHIESGDECHKGVTARKCHCEAT